MTIRFEIDERVRLVRFVADAVPSRSEWKSSFDEAFGDLRFRPGFDVIYDRRGVAEIPQPARLRRWMLIYGRTMRARGAGRVAVLVDELVIFGLMRVAAVYAEDEGLELGVFWTEAEALQWLGH